MTVLDTVVAISATVCASIMSIFFGYGGIKRRTLFVKLCKRKGVCAPYDSCSKFVYAPLKRIPKRAPQLLTYEKEDFSL